MGLDGSDDSLLNRKVSLNSHHVHGLQLVRQQLMAGAPVNGRTAYELCRCKACSTGDIRLGMRWNCLPSACRAKVS